MGYFILTLLYTMWIPFTIQFILFFADLYIELYIGKIYPDLFLVLVPMLSFLAMMGYGRWVTDAKRNHPKSMAAIYMPVFLPLLWYLFLTAIFNFNHVTIRGRSGVFFLILLVLNIYGSFFYETVGSGRIYLRLLGDLLFYGVLIAGFAVGERRNAHSEDIKRTPFSAHWKPLIIGCGSIICFYTVSEINIYQYRESQNLILSAHASYGFAYEGGYSSINLQPYYVNNESNILAKLDEPADFIISDPHRMPILDGAEAAYPVYSAFANACYEDIANIDDSPIQFTNTIYAYERLLEGEVDIFFGAKPSEEQIQMANDYGKKLILTPIGKEAFVFFVNDRNPVDKLSSDQIRAIYSGEITNWNKVGGRNKKILAFQRPENSGSQTMMEYFMGDIPLKEPLETEYEEPMMGIVRSVAAYDNGKASIGYSFRYYASIMISNSNEDLSNASASNGIKFLAIDGVYPDEETIRSGEYPLTTQLYAITVVDKNSLTGTYSKDTIEPFLKWMTGPQGQKIIADTGYISLEKY